jgi:hypothetical protein
MMTKPWNFEGASCLGINTDFYFPEPKSFSDENRLAKVICGTCICKQECLTYALENNVDGIWGGKTPRERSTIRRQLNITPKPITESVYKK